MRDNKASIYKYNVIYIDKSLASKLVIDTLTGEILQIRYIGQNSTR